MCTHFFFTHKTWLSTDTWKRIEERKTIKSKIINTKSKRIQERLQLEYSNKENGIKRSSWSDRRAHMGNDAMCVEMAAERCEMSTVYRLTKQFCRHTQAGLNKQMMSGKTNGTDTICTKMLKTNIHFAQTSLEIYGQIMLYPLIGIGANCEAIKEWISSKL